MIKKIVIVFCGLFLAFQMSAYAANYADPYADPLLNDYVLTLTECLGPGNTCDEGEIFEYQGITLRQKVQAGVPDSVLTYFDLWQMDMKKGAKTALVLHPLTTDESDPSFTAPNAAIFKTISVIKGQVKVTLGNCKNPYVAQERDTIHLIPGTPHQFEAMKDCILMIYCYGEAVSGDLGSPKNFIRAYAEKITEDAFTTLPNKEDLACNREITNRNFLYPYNFEGPVNEIRPSRKQGSLISVVNYYPTDNSYLKVSPAESFGAAEFFEFEWFNFDYYPHEHADFHETMLVTYKEATFWLGAGTENGQINVDDPNYGIPTYNPDGTHSARIGDGIRMKPGYISFMPPNVPHSMADTEWGNIWLGTASPIGYSDVITLELPNKVYQPLDQGVGATGTAEKRRGGVHKGPRR